MAQKIKYPMKFEKNLCQNEREEHENLPGSNREGLCRTMLPEFASEVLSSNALCWVKNSNGMKILKFFTIYRNILKFLATFYSFGRFFTV